MRKISIFILSVMILGLLSGCGKKADTVAETESSDLVSEIVTEKPSEEPTETPKETDTEEDSEAVTDESKTEAPTQENNSKETENVKADNADTNNQNNDSSTDNTKQPEEVQPQPAVVEPEPEPEPETPAPAQTISYSPQNVVALATAKVKAGGKTTLTDDLDNLLAAGTITKEEYDSYYPYDGAGYYSVFVDSNMAEARDVSGTEHFNSEDDIATYIAEMLLLENGNLFLIEYAGTYDYYGKQCYEFRCYRA